MERKIKVLVVDDSAMVRKIFARELAKDPALDVVGSAPEPFIARDKIVRLQPDVVILDLEMPKMDGLTFLAKLMTYYPLPVIVVSSLARDCEVAFKALELGALDVMAKPGESYTVQDMSGQLIEKIKAVAQLKPFLSPVIAHPPPPAAVTTKPAGTALTRSSSHKIIAIGASTGGTEAITRVLSGLPDGMPPILVAQHMPQYFTAAFAKRLNELCRLEVSEAVDGDLVRPGRVLLAPGNRHMELKRSGARYFVEVRDGPLVFGQRPSVEVLFQSVAARAGKNAVGVIMTGMGKDGATGLLAMKKAGAHTIAQDERSCVVYGMPKEAAEIGAAMQIVPLDEIPRAILERI